jgi:hypothetical protein
VNARRTAKVSVVAGVLALVFVCVSPSVTGRRLRHRLHRYFIAAEIQLSKWRGSPPRLASVSGQVELPGAEVQALDSRSGWASLSDPEGRFTLPGVVWYPGAGYDILISSDYEEGRFARVSTSSTLPPDGVFQAGRLNPAGALVSLIRQPGVNSYSSEPYDQKNRDYYVDLYQRLTADKESDDDKVNAVNKFIGTRLNYEQTGKDLGSARRVIDEGSEFCGHLVVAMATIIVTGYRARILHLMDTSVPPNTHAVVEVFYAGDWHLYDPTFGTRFLDEKGQVASYKTLRLNPSLVSAEAFSEYRRLYPKSDSVGFMPAIYSSGYHHFSLIDFPTVAR